MIDLNSASVLKPSAKDRLDRDWIDLNMLAKNLTIGKD